MAGRPKRMKNRMVMYVDEDILSWIRSKRKPKQADNDVLRELIGEKNIQVFGGSSSKDIFRKE